MFNAGKLLEEVLQEAKAQGGWEEASVALICEFTRLLRGQSMINAEGANALGAQLLLDSTSRGGRLPTSPPFIKVRTLLAASVKSEGEQVS